MQNGALYPLCNTVLLPHLPKIRLVVLLFLTLIWPNGITFDLLTFLSFAVGMYLSVHASYFYFRTNFLNQCCKILTHYLSLFFFYFDAFFSLYSRYVFTNVISSRAFGNQEIYCYFPGEIICQCKKMFPSPYRFYGHYHTYIRVSYF